MRTYIITAILLIASLSIFGQGNLQFNQVLNYNITVVGSNSIYTTQDLSVTVPAGKVWKIESVISSRFFDSSTDQYRTGGYVLLDNVVIFNADDIFPKQTPIWLKAGNYTITLQAESLDNRNTYDAFISVVEFNVITN